MLKTAYLPKTMRGAIDTRTYLILLLLSSIAIVLIQTELGLLALFCTSMLWQAWIGKANKIPRYLLLYGVLFGFTALGAILLTANYTSVFGTVPAIIGLYGRKMLIPFLFSIELAKIPNGSFLSALSAAHIPKPVGLSVLILFRFFPTLGQEFQAIRNAQKFRGIGNSLSSIITRTLETAECFLIPLIMRATKVSDELAASITVRGVRLTNKITSFQPVRFTKNDLMYCILAFVFYASIFIIERI